MFQSQARSQSAGDFVSWQGSEARGQRFNLRREANPRARLRSMESTRLNPSVYITAAEATRWRRRWRARKLHKSMGFNLRREANPLATLLICSLFPLSKSFNLRREANPLATPLVRQDAAVRYLFQSQARSQSAGDGATWY